MPTVTRLPNVPPEIRRVAGMAPDYADVFTVEAPRATEVTAEEWARIALARGGRPGRLLWRRVLGLQLHRSPSSVVGWSIGARGERWIRLEASSWFMTAHVVVYVDDEQLTVATLVRYDRLLGALVWPFAAIVHRGAVPVLLRGAVTHRPVPVTQDRRTGDG
jgi:hypothetical protein